LITGAERLAPNYSGESNRERNWKVTGFSATKEEGKRVEKE
jgi:hypothetical protein